VKIALAAVATWCTTLGTPAGGVPGGAGKDKAMDLTTTIPDGDLRSCVEGSAQLAVAKLVKVSGPEGDYHHLVVEVQEMLGPRPGRGRLELRSSGEEPVLTAKRGQLLLIVASPFRHRTDELSLSAAALIPDGRRQEVVEEVRARLDRLRPRISDETLRGCAQGGIQIGMVKMMPPSMDPGPELILVAKLLEPICGTPPRSMKLVRKDKKAGIAIREDEVLAVAVGPTQPGAAFLPVVDFEPVYEGRTAEVAGDLRARLAALKGPR
jgi:hypothetical protein